MNKKRGWYHNVSKERREEIRKKISAGVKKQHQNMSKDKKLEMRIKQSKKRTEYFENLTPEEFEIVNKKRKLGIAKTKIPGSLQEREAYEYASYIGKQRFKKMTPEERRSYSSNGIKAIQKKWDDGSMHKVLEKVNKSLREYRQQFNETVERKNNYCGVVHG